MVSTFGPSPEHSCCCRPEQATEAIAGTSVAYGVGGSHQAGFSFWLRWRRSGRALRDLVPAYLNHPDWTVHPRHQREDARQKIWPSVEPHLTSAEGHDQITRASDLEIGCVVAAQQEAGLPLLNRARMPPEMDHRSRLRLLSLGGIGYGKQS